MDKKPGMMQFVPYHGGNVPNIIDETAIVEIVICGERSYTVPSDVAKELAELRQQLSAERQAKAALLASHKHVEELLSTAEQRVRELLAKRCETCGATINVKGCANCGAPQCCTQCCKIDTLESKFSAAQQPSEIAEPVDQILYEVTGWGESDLPEVRFAGDIQGVKDAISLLMFYRQTEEERKEVAEMCEELNEKTEFPWKVDFEIGGIRVQEVSAWLPNSFPHTAELAAQMAIAACDKIILEKMQQASPSQSLELAMLALIAIRALSAPEIAAELERTQRNAAIGAEWERDSSLEKWFPITAEQLEQEHDIRTDRESTITQVAEALGVKFEPHQTFFERLPQVAKQMRGDAARLAQAVWGNWMTIDPMHDSGKERGCEYCDVRFEAHEPWEKVIHESNCVVSLATRITSASSNGEERK